LAVQVCRELHPEVEGVSMLRSCVLAIGFAALLGAPGLGLAAPVCNDGIDNDGDGETDFPNDPGCASEVDNAETDSETECDGWAIDP
jgi:hypothetical protein